MKKPINVFFTHQAFIDLVACILVVVRETLVSLDIQGPAGVCHLIWTNTLTWIVLYTSSYNFLMLTIERHFAIVNPFGYHADKVMKRLPLIFTAEWVLMSLAWLWVSVTTVYEDGRCIISKRLYGTVGLLVGSQFLFVIAFVIPLPILLFCYARMLYTLYRASHPKHSTTVTTNEKATHAAQMNILQTCIIMLVAFVVCWTISQSAVILFTFGYYTTILNTHVYLGRFVVFLNSAINPYIWAIRHKEFQQQMKRLLGFEQNIPTERSTHVSVIRN